MPSKRSIRSNEELIDRLIKKDDQLNSEDLHNLSRSEIVHKAFEYGVIDEIEFIASIPSDNYVVKSYLWSYLHNPTHRKKVREYAIVCTKIQNRAYLTLKTAYFLCSSGQLGEQNNVETFVKALLTQPSKGFEYLVLPEHLPDTSHPLKPIVDATRRAKPEFYDGLCNSLENLVKRSGLSNAKNYIATKIRTAVFNNVFMHLHSRVRGSLEARKHPNEQSDLNGMTEFYMKGSTDKFIGVEDKKTIISLRKVFLSEDESTKEKELPEASQTPTEKQMLLHLDCCKLAEDTSKSFTPFPNASFTRCYQRLCTYLFCLLLGVKDMHATINLSPSFEQKQAKHNRNKVSNKKKDKSKQNGKRKRKRNGYFTMRKNGKNALVTSIETDGVGMSIVLLIERPQSETNIKNNGKPFTLKEKKEFAIKKRQEKICKFVKIINKERNEVILKGLDPGRVNLYTTAEENGKNGEHPNYEKQFYSRNRHLKKCARDRMTEWRDKQAQQPHIAHALRVLSTTGGAKTNVASRWFSYLNERFTHQQVLEEEFMLDDERYKKKMVQFRLAQRALTRAADRIILANNEPDQNNKRKPVIIGYGTGKGNGGGHKGEPAVPVKAMYRALIQAFKRHRIEGGVLDIWEHLTTKKCYKCHEFTKAREISWSIEDVEKEKKRLTERWEVLCREAEEKNEPKPTLILPSDDELLSRKKIDRDFRICESCHSCEQPWKLRNRDFNAAINILILLETELEGKERPEYLRTQKKKRTRVV